ncbi:MAG: hypothetical protein HY298_19140 [Verrucomicrobia bacterium]|nr:hypothetical protein [Verrucomicrobiota bacterium]
MWRNQVGSVLVLSCACVLTAQTPKPLYENNFETAAVGSVPGDFLVQDGAFTVKEESGNKFLELPGAPLDTFGLYFGPTEKDETAASARFSGVGKGRRFPTFAVGLGAGGLYRLQVSPAKKLLELYKGEILKGSVPHDWQSGTWTFLKLQVRKVKDGEWKVEGQVWAQGKAEPEGWAIIYDEKEEPIAGRASLWASPYAGTPIRFDDLVVAPVSAK